MWQWKLFHQRTHLRECRRECCTTQMLGFNAKVLCTAFFFRIWHMVVLYKSPLGFLLREFPDGITWREWFADIIWYNVLSEVPMLKWLEGIYIENTTHISSTHCVHLLFCCMSTLDTSGDHHGRRTLAWNSNTHVLWLWNLWKMLKGTFYMLYPSLWISSRGTLLLQVKGCICCISHSVSLTCLMYILYSQVITCPRWHLALGPLSHTALPW